MKPQGLLALMVAVLVVQVASAGVYNSAEPDWPLNTDFYKFRDVTLIPLRQLGSPETQTPDNRRYQMMSRMPRSASLTVEERLNLGAYLIRFRKPREAAQVLSEASRLERDNFRVLANLATAEQLDNQLLRAEGYLAEALRVWPEKFQDLPEATRTHLLHLGWNEGPHAWNREVETYHYKMLKRRTVEKPGGLPEEPDKIFGDIHFVGESTKFELGKLARAEREKLPKNAVTIVQQLLVWLPEDMRLYWLFGELLNADGKTAEALEVFEEIDKKWNPKPQGIGGFQARRTNPKLFQEHYEILKAQPKVIPNIDVGTEPPIKPPVKTPDAPAPRFDWRAFGVGIAAGLLISLFGYWQIREIRRRQQSRAGVK